VSDLLRYGQIRLSDWPAMTLVAQIFWGGLFAKLFGLSYMTLRVSVICLAFAGALALYYWARAIERTRLESLFLALLYATSPLVFSLSYSFMTDVPGASLILLGLLVQAHCARRGGTLLHLLAGATASGGYLVRQTAALPALVLAFSMVPAVLQKRTRARDLLALIMPLALVVNVHRYWLEHIHGLPYQGLSFRVAGLVPLLGLAMAEATTVSLYLFPLVVCLWGTRARTYAWASTSAKLGVGISFACALALTAAFGLGLPAPYTQQVGDTYLGYETIAGDTLSGPHLDVGPFSLNVFSLATVVGLVSLSTAMVFVLIDLRGRWLSWRQAFAGICPLSPGDQAGVCGVALLGVLVTQAYPFDRYLVPVIPALAMYLLSRLPRDRGPLRSPLPWLVLGVFAMTSVVGTQDFFARARARWQVVDRLVEAGIAPRDIMAGFEHAALYAFAPHYRQLERVRPYLLDLPKAEREARLRVEDPTVIWQDLKSTVVRYRPVVGVPPMLEVPWASWVRSGSVFAYHVEIRRRPP